MGAAVGETGDIADGWPTLPAELPRSCRCDGIGTAMGMMAAGDPGDVAGVAGDAVLSLLVVLAGPGDVDASMPRNEQLVGFTFNSKDLG